MFHTFSLVCFLIYSVNSSSGHDQITLDLLIKTHDFIRIIRLLIKACDLIKMISKNICFYKNDKLTNKYTSFYKIICFTD